MATETAETPEYLILNTAYTRGGTITWWRHEGKGYTTNFDDAGLYTRTEAFRQHRSREEDVPVKKSVAEQLVRRVVSDEYVTKFKRECAEVQKADARPTSAPVERNCDTCDFKAMDPDSIYCAHKESLDRSSGFGISLASPAHFEFCGEPKGYPLWQIRRPR